MILETAIGDAYGAGFEFIDEETLRKENTLSDYRRHPKHNLLPGTYTDDTQMSLAIVELILDDMEFTPINLANKFVEVFKRDRRDGYARGFQTFLEEVKTGREFLEKIKPESKRSGAAMRSSPIGLIPEEEKAIDYSIKQARITHNTLEGIDSAIASTLITHYFFYDLGSKKDLGNWLEKKVSRDWSIPHRGRVSVDGIPCVSAALTAIVRYNSLSEILRSCVDFTGDTDTVAAIAMAAASNSREVKKDLPRALFDKIERGPYGYDYLIDLDNKLQQKFGGNN